MKAKKGNLTVQILVLLIVIVFTSATMLLLLKLGVISPSGSEAELLNTEFIPVAREGKLEVNDFQFCAFIDENKNCISPRERFEVGSTVYFRFVAKSSPANGVLNLVENYRLERGDGLMVLEAQDKDNFYYSLDSDKEEEEIIFTDYFTVGEDVPDGEYILHLILSNPVAGRQVTENYPLMLEVRGDAE